jgi:hypothetical protein
VEPSDRTVDGADEDPREPAPEDPTVARGRLQLVAVAVSLIGSVILVAALGASASGAAVVQLAVIGLLLFQVFRGRGWARWLLVGLTGLGAAGNAWQAVRTFGAAGDPWLLSAGLAVIYGWCAAILAFGHALGRFLEARRARER